MGLAIMLRIFSASLSLLLTCHSAYARGPQVVSCEGGVWSGYSVAYEKDGVKSFDDNTTLPATVYKIDYDANTAVMLDDKTETKASIVHSHLDYTTISYVYRNVHYTDTLFSNGTIITQFAKMSLIYWPIGSSFHKVCTVVQ